MSATIVRAIIGLGNPGKNYARTRHNAGFWLADALAEASRVPFRLETRFQGELALVKVGSENLLVLKPITFMNNSGASAQALASFYKIAPSELLIVHDELDLPAGTARYKLGGGHGGHNGLRSLHDHIGADYRRLRIGIGHPGHKDLVHDYVLSKAPVADENLIRESIDKAIATLPTLLSQGWERAVHQLHTEAAKS